MCKVVLKMTKEQKVKNSPGEQKRGSIIEYLKLGRRLIITRKREIIYF